MTDKFLVVKLDRYAGNVDEIVCVALTGWGFERYGGEQARKVFEAKVVPLLPDPEEEFPDLPLEFYEFKTNHGIAPYELDESSSDNLRLGIDKYSTPDRIQDMLDLWDKAYGDGLGTLHITVDDIHGKSVTVKVLGFDLVEIKESRTTLR